MLRHVISNSAMHNPQISSESQFAAAEKLGEFQK